MENEIWKPVVGYEGLYEVSNLGRLRSVERILKRPEGEWHYKEKILRAHKTNKGYLRTRLYRNGVAQTLSIHRLVLTAFVPNPQNLPMINHKNEKVWDNRLDNLEWCDNSYNQRYGHAQDTKFRKVVQIGENFRKEYPSITEASRQTGICLQRISMCARKVKQCKTAGGYRWEFI